MYKEKEIFEEHTNCETPGTCILLEMCQRALVIEIEMDYERKKPGQSVLSYTIENATCKHQEVAMAVKEAERLLNKNLKST